MMMETDLTYTFPSENGRATGTKTYLLHFDGPRGTYTKECQAGSLKEASAHARRIEHVLDVRDFIRGVEEK